MRKRLSPSVRCSVNVLAFDVPRIDGKLATTLAKEPIRPTWKTQMCENEEFLENEWLSKLACSLFIREEGNEALMCRLGLWACRVLSDQA